MNEIEFENIMLITRRYKHMCVSISTFTDFMKPEWMGLLDPITQRDMLMRGLYGGIGACNIWVCKTVKPGCIKVSNHDITDAKDETKWSPLIPIMYADQMERYTNLKAFW